MSREGISGGGCETAELSRLMVQRIQQASDIVEGLAFQPMQGRLAQLLLGHFGDAVDKRAKDNPGTD